MTTRPYAAATALAALLALAGCASLSAASAPQSPASGGAAPASSPAPATPADAPDTAAAARRAARSLFALYAAGDYTAVYPLLAASVRAQAPERKWVAVHEKCKSPAAGLSYKVGRPVMAGDTAVMSVSLAGAASSLGSLEETFVYEDGAWHWRPSASDMSAAGGYRGTVARIVARLKAAGRCG